MEEYYGHFNVPSFITLYGNVIPLVIWYFIVYKYIYKVYFNNIFSVSGLILSIPLIVAMINIYLFYTSKSGLPYSFTPCFSRKILEENKKAGMIGYWDIKCTDKHNDAVEGIGVELTNKFYYLGYLLFLLILITQSSPQRKEHSRHLLLCICWILGIIGSAISMAFRNHNYYSILPLYVGSAILQIYISILLFTLLYLGKTYFN